MDTRHAIRAGWLVDGAGSVTKDQLLTIEEGQIVGVEPYGAAGQPADAPLTDLSFATLLPPLVDCHVHLTMNGTMDCTVRERLGEADCQELEGVIVENLRQLTSFGVFAVRDGGDRGGCVAAWLAKVGEKTPIIVQTPGPALYRQDRYGSLIGRPVAGGMSQAAVWSGQMTDSPWIKLVNSGLNSLKTYGRRTAPQFRASEIAELVQAARRHDRKVMVHANGEEPVREAVVGGCHSIEHGFFMGRDNLQRMADSGCVWVPTAITMKAYAEVLSYQGEQQMADVARRNLEHQLRQLRLAREFGVSVALGTDAGSPGVLHGESVFEEMKLLAQAGYSLAEIIQAATSTGAELLGLAGRGRIAKGRDADFLVARGTPAQLPRKLSYLEAVYIGGRPAAYYRKNPVKHVAPRSA